MDKRRHTTPVQRTLPFRGRGGARPGAGRKATGTRAGVPHRPRGTLASRHPVHVTARLRAGLPGLRRRQTLGALYAPFAAGGERFGFRLVQWSVQDDHLHLLVEAKDQHALARGMQGLLIRVAKALNRQWKRRGSVFVDRYHSHVLRTPREVRNALAYVLNNALHHCRGFGLRRITARLIDPFASGAGFDGWSVQPEVVMVSGAPPPAAARTWLLRTGWRRHGLIRPGEVPGQFGKRR